MSQVFLWIEDREGKSSFCFWKTIMEQLCPNVVVESKKNNSELVKAVRNLNDVDNKYIIVFDNSFDNLQIAKEHKLLLECVKQKDNVALMDIICFEYILLEFKDLIEWIYAKDDEFLIKRKNTIIARQKLLDMMNSEKNCYKSIEEIANYCSNIEEYNIEKISAKLLFDLTRNTGFEVSKGKIGDCWIKSCCDWENRMSDDICGLDEHRLNIRNKMKQIYEKTCLKEQFKNVDLEVDNE